MIELTQGIKEIERNINKAIAQEVNVLLFQKKSRIEKECTKLVSGWIISQPEIKSLDEITFSFSSSSTRRTL